MRESKCVSAVKKVVRGIVFAGGGVLFCLLLVGLGILYAGISLAFGFTDALLKRLERRCQDSEDGSR